jgi:hypothetical protein
MVAGDDFVLAIVVLARGVDAMWMMIQLSDLEVLRGRLSNSTDQYKGT